MNASVRVDLHLHSNRSDGDLTPEALAERVADAGVVFAALTDHNTLDGAEAFRKAFARRGGVALPAGELTVAFQGRPIHILAYGVHAADSSLWTSSNGLPSLEEALDVIHAAGGIAFLAHPLHDSRDPEELVRVVVRLKSLGLDGLEAFYGPYSDDEQQLLAGLADRHGLLVCGGSDYHGPASGPEPRIGVDLDPQRWRRFRDALPMFKEAHRRPTTGTVDPHAFAVPRDWHWFLLHIVLPAALCLALFAGAAFGLVLPAFEDQLLARKREMIRELVNAAWSILDAGDRDVRAGRATLQEAQREAVERIRRMRYGPEGKDYFWITDMHPRMIMHPYRPDLEGTDLAGFTDPHGVRLFVEVVQTVRRSGHGYVAYVWQWKDQPERLEPKESYVRGFAPWGWIIGTGIYTDDVMREIAAIERRMLEIALAIAVVIGVLLFLLVLESARMERRRLQAEHDLRESHEKYRALVEAERDGALILVGGRCVYANQPLLDMLGYTEAELPFLDWSDLTHPEHEVSLPLAQEPVEVRLRRKDGSALDALLSAGPVTMAGREGILVVMRDLTEHAAAQRRRSAEREALLDQMRTAWLFLSKPVGSLMRTLPICPLDATIAQAVETMAQGSADAVVLAAETGPPAGIVTDHDLRVRVLAARRPPANPAREIMSTPLLSIAEDAPVSEALRLIGDPQRNHLVVTDAHGRAVGIVGCAELARIHAHTPTALTAAVARAETVDQVAGAQARLPVFVQTLLETGVRPRMVSRTVTSVSDAVVDRLMALAFQEVGAPPLPFTWLAFGSEGRAEQTLVTDQDNAIVYADPPPESAEAAADYFRRLAERVNVDLDRAGYARCKGGMMACNPRWNQPISKWKEDFGRWIAEPDPQELLQCNVCFDLRGVHGAVELAGDLFAHVLAVSNGRSSFFYNLSQTILPAKPAAGLFGHLMPDSLGAANVVNLKVALLPLVGFARLYALQNGIEATHTLDRLRALEDRHALSQPMTRDLEQAYDFLMTLRYRRQVDRLAAGQPADNEVDLDALSPLELQGLKQSLAAIAFIHKKIEIDQRAGM